jgi:hypothetical protein
VERQLRQWLRWLECAELPYDDTLEANSADAHHRLNNVNSAGQPRPRRMVVVPSMQR